MSILQFKNRIVSRAAALLLAASISLCFGGAASSQTAASTQEDDTGALAKEYTDSVRLSTPGTQSDVNKLRDNDYNTKIKFEWGGEVMVRSSADIYGLYLVWDVPPSEWYLVIGGKQNKRGENGYLHQFIEIPNGQAQFNVQFFKNATLCDIRVFGEGELPDELQVWDAPLEDADMLVLPTHGDDEHIYFGGTMPAYTAAGMAVQVAYMVNHNGEPNRPHEILNGLWSAGIRNYPIIPKFYDKYADSLEEAKTIYDEDEILAYQVGLIRRFKPEVIIGHDTNGEYGHGAHILNSRTLQKAVEAAADPEQLTDTAELYGAWDTKKTYLHLWEENPIVMDWDIPLDYYGGKTAMDMAKESYAFHISQQSAFQVADGGKYDCRKFGLFRTTVGPDVLKNDFFENIKTVYPPAGSVGSASSEVSSEAASSEAASSETISSETSSSEPAASSASSQSSDLPASADSNSLYQALRWGLVAVAVAIAAITVAIWCVLFQNRRLMAKKRQNKEIDNQAHDDTDDNLLR